MASLTLLLLICHVTSLVSPILQPPTNLKLISENFRHILTWDEPNNEAVIYYKVDFQKNGNQLVSSKSCSKITSRSCDLTRDFTDIFSEYIAKVNSFTDHEVSDVVVTKSFNPLEHTLLGPALVDLVPGDHCIKVSIQPPISHLWSEIEQRNVSMDSDEVYPLMQYVIRIRHPGEGEHSIQIHDISNATIIPELLPNTNYCVSVDVKAGENLEPCIPSPQKCVVTGNGDVSPTSSPGRMEVIIPVVFGSLLFLGILLILVSLDRAGYIGMQRKFFPKVLKSSFPHSGSRYSGNSEHTSPGYIDPVEIVSQKIKEEKSLENEDHYKEGGYASRKKLLDSDTSGGDSSGPVLTTNSSSFESSGQTTGSSGEEKISIQHPTGLGIITDSAESSPIPANDLELPSDLPIDNSGVFNIDLTTICIGNPKDTSLGLTNGGSLKENPEREADVDSGQARLSLNGDIIECTANVLLDMEPTATEYGSDDYEEENSHNCPSHDHIVSGYMRR